MNYLHSILVIVLFLFCSSFTKVTAQQVKEQLTTWGQLVTDHPDSILQLIKNSNKLKLSAEENEQLEGIIANAYRIKGQSDTAMILFEAIINKGGKAKNKTALADAYLKCSRIYEQKNQNEKSIEYNHKALQLGNILDDQSIINVAANNIGYIYLFTDAYDSAAFYFEKSYQSNCLLKDSLRMASCKNNMFVAYYRLGKFEQSVEALIESLKIKERISTPESFASGLSNLADLYLKLDKLEEAKRTIQKALTISETNKLAKLSAILYSNLGVVVRQTENATKSLPYHEKAYAIYDSLGLETDKGKALKNIGAVYNMMGNFPKALNYSLRALAIIKKGNSKRLEGQTSVDVAMLYLDMNEPSNAISYAQAAFEISKQVDELEMHVRANSALSRYYEATGNYHKAFEYQKDFKAYNDSLNSVEAKKIVHELEAKFESEKKENEIIQLTTINRINELEINEKDARLKQHQILLFSILTVVLLLGILSYLLFTRYKLKQQNMQVQLQKQRVELEQRLIRSQMNPHFIFNALTSIQGLVTSQRTEQALTYLTKFATLLRLILEHSRQEYISLSDEIKSLQLYVEIEQMRHHDLFTYELDDQTDEAEFISVPPMLLQPFVENAIKHGFRSKTLPGKLLIQYKIENEQLICTVDDNGIGRIASNAEKASQTIPHKSMALTLIAERIELLKQEWSSAITLVIVDFLPEIDGRTGTQVSLKLPVREL